MNYIWDIIIKARQLGIDETKIKFIAAKSYSPYMELSNENINFKDVDQEVELNPYYRFYEIFKYFFSLDNFEDLELRETLFDVAIHFLTSIDLMSGMNKREFYSRFIIADINNGLLGKDIKEGFELFDRMNQIVIAQNIIRLYITGEGLYLLKDTVRRIFHKSTIYANYETIDELLFYIPYERNDINVAKFEFIKTLFLPINFRVEVYWMDHFGIIGTDETMKIDKIALY